MGAWRCVAALSMTVVVDQEINMQKMLCVSDCFITLVCYITHMQSSLSFYIDNSFTFTLVICSNNVYFYVFVYLYLYFLVSSDCLSVLSAFLCYFY